MLDSQHNGDLSSEAHATITALLTTCLHLIRDVAGFAGMWASLAAAEQVKKLIPFTGWAGEWVAETHQWAVFLSYLLFCLVVLGATVVGIFRRLGVLKGINLRTAA